MGFAGLEIWPNMGLYLARKHGISCGGEQEWPVDYPTSTGGKAGDQRRD